MELYFKLEHPDLTPLPVESKIMIKLMLLEEFIDIVMSEIVSFKVRKEVKEKMVKYRGVVDWGEELRKFVEEKIRELEARENLRRVVEELRAASWSVPKGFASGSVREDRDSG